MATRSLHPLRSAIRFARSWSSPPSSVSATEVSIPDSEGGAAYPGTLFRSTRSGSSTGHRTEGRPNRAWLVLHGMSRRGRRHPELVRFARAVATTGAPVIVPEVREWTELDFAPDRARDIIRATTIWLDDDSESRGRKSVLVGFSFGATQALAAAAEPDIGQHLQGVVAWGGYADLERTIRFSFTGQHEWRGIRYHVRPDPYVRWVTGANCLRFSGRLDPDGAVANALRALATEAGEQRIRSRESDSDPLKRRLRENLPIRDRALFDLFAPPADQDPDRQEASDLVDELMPTVRRELPRLDPIAGIGRISVPVRLLHGRADDLIPYTETLRLEAALASRARDLTARVTGLFTHTGEDAGRGVVARAWENARYLSALRGIFEIA